MHINQPDALAPSPESYSGECVRSPPGSEPRSGPDTETSQFSSALAGRDGYRWTNQVRLFTFSRVVSRCMGAAIFGLGRWSFSGVVLSFAHSRLAGF